MKYLLSCSFFFFLLSLNAQISHHTHPSLLAANFEVSPIPSVILHNTNSPSVKSSAPSLTTSQFMNVNNRSQSCVYNYHDLAFFCKMEVKLEKAVRLPVKFRLGSVQYVDYLEGKNNYGDYVPRK